VGDICPAVVAGMARTGEGHTFLGGLGDKGLLLIPGLGVRVGAPADQADALIYLHSRQAGQDEMKGV